jgi:pimeloyl-ACP methyl ester carboxylesterase
MRALLTILLLVTVARAADWDEVLAEADAADWRRRWPAVVAISRATGDDVFRLRGRLLRDERPRVREAIAWACVLEPSLGQSTLLGLALKKDDAAPVRRAAARALIHFPDRRAVAALVEALVRERDVRTRLRIVATLRALTPAPCLLDGEAWSAWWSKHEADPRFQPADEPARKGEYEGVVLETRTVAPIPGKGGHRRKPPHVLVLPQFGWSTAAFGPYLLPLRERAALSWVRLPTVQQLTGRSGFGDDIPTYPVDRLVRALERFRASLKIERFVVLAHGASGWIAMRYAVKYPKHCAGLVLIDTALDKEAYAGSLQRAAAYGDATEKYAARTLMGQGSMRLTEPILHRLQADGITHGFLDPADLEAAWMFHHAREPQGFATVPDISWSRHRRIDLPAVFVYSAASAFSGHRDAGRIQRHFPNSLVAPINEARGMPFVEENTAFHRVLAHWFDKLGTD